MKRGSCKPDGSQTITDPKRFSKCQHFNVFRTLSFWFVTSGVLCLKCLLIPSYHSTDFEVHRNWMAITKNLSVDKWYYDETSKWTLDYPPFFAFFEYALSLVADYFIPSSLVLQSEPWFSSELLYFHRFTVLFADLLFIFSCGFFANSFAIFSRSLPFYGSRSVAIVLLANTALVMVDNIHFQYNGFLTSFFLISLGFAAKQRFLCAALFFCILLNFKHLYLYYAPAYVVFFLKEYLLQKNIQTVFRRTFKLAFVMLTPFIMSFGIFVHRVGVNVVPQIFRRLFPFQRGLTHAYWAPNLWACYNFVDFCLYKILKYLKKLPLNTKLPQYTSGLVGEYSHSILPNMLPTHSLICVFLLLLPMLAMMSNKFTFMKRFAVLLTHSAFAFFLAGYHVHEKAIVIIIIPFTILAFCDLRYMDSFILISSVANVSLFPLFFTSFENVIKIMLALLSHFFISAIVRHNWPNFKKLSLSKRLYLLFLLVLQFYALFIHKAVFSSNYEFVPLMLTSVSTAFGVIFTFFEFFLLTYCGLDGPFSRLISRFRKS